MTPAYEIILNPSAGKGSAGRSIPAIRNFMERRSLPYRLHITERPGHAVDIAAALPFSNDTAVIAAGGDGTCNEAANGLLSSRFSLPGQSSAPEAPLFGVLPIGRGNDFSFGAGLPGTLQAALELLAAPRYTLVDAGRVIGGDYPGGRFFVNGIGIGFDTIVGLEAAKMRFFHGSAGYALGAVKTLIRYPEPPALQIELDRDRTLTETAALVSIMNGRRMGGSFYMAPNAMMNDGMLNICLTRHGRRLKLLKTMVRYIRGTQAGLDNTLTAAASSIRVEAIRGAMAVHADGETICISGKELIIDCIPDAFRLIGTSGDQP